MKTSSTILVLLAMSAVAAPAFSAPPASDPIVSATYDIDTSAHRVKITLLQPTAYGSFDGNLIMSHPRNVPKGANTSVNAFELGYGNGVKAGPVGLRGRIAYGDNFAGNAPYMLFGAEALTPITDHLGLFVNYRHRHGLHSTVIPNNRYTLGVDVSLSPTTLLRVGAYQTQTPATSTKTNGATFAVFYRF